MSFARDIRTGLGLVFGRKAYEHVPMGVQGRPQYPATDVETLQDVYAKNELVYAAIERKATAAIDVRLVVEQRKGPKDEWEEVPGHPFRRMMMLPNPAMRETDFLRAMIVSMDVAGVFYAEKVFKGVLPTELHPLNPANVFPVPRPDGKADYLYKEGSHKEVIPWERMLVKRRYDPRNKFNGLSPLAVAMGSIDADNAQTDFIRAFFNNAGVPSGILKVAGKLNQDQADELRLKWRARLGRLAGKQHDITVLDDKAEYQKVGSGLDELASQDIRSFTESRLAMAFDVPPLIIYAYVGLLRATYDNLKGAWQGFWTASLKPMYKDWADWLTWELLTDYGLREAILAETVRLRFDVSEVDWLKDSVNESQARARDNFQAGALTLNEFRAKIGEQGDPNGDYYLRLFNRIPVPVGEVLTGVEVLDGAATGDTTGDTTDEGQKNRRGMNSNLWEVRLKKKNGRAVIEARMAKAVRKLLAGQYEAAAAAVEQEAA